MIYRLVVFASVFAASQQPVDPGAALRDGLTFVVGTGENETPWVVDSLTRGIAIGDHKTCVRFRLRIGTTPPVTRIFCHRGNELHTLRLDGELVSTRPIVPGTYTSRPSDGSVVTFEVAAPSVDTISGIAIPVLPTVITTRDSTGRLIRRRTERFSVSHLTALSSTSSVPDSTKPGGSRQTQRFAISRIR